MSITFAENLEKMIDAGLGGEVIAPNTSVAVGYQMQYNLVMGPVASWNDPEGGLPVNIVTEFEPIQSGTGDPSPENIRPISGRQSVSAWRSGKNLFDYRDSANWRVATSATERRLPVSGEFALDGDTLTYARRTSLHGAVFILGYLFGGTTYTFNYHPTDQIYYAKIDGDYSDSYTATRIASGANTFTPETDGYYEVLIYASRQSIYEFTNLQLEDGSVETAYVPGTVKTVTVQLGDTIYGGRLNVTTGVMTVEWANIASYDGETLPGEWISDREVYAPGTTPTTGAQVCYKLAEPVTVQLSPQTITSLLGQNNVWSDAGDVSVTWKEKLYTEGY